MHAWRVYTLLAHNLTVGVDLPGHNLSLAGLRDEIRTSSGLLKKLVGRMWLSAQAVGCTTLTATPGHTDPPGQGQWRFPPGRFPTWRQKETVEQN